MHRIQLALFSLVLGLPAFASFSSMAQAASPPARSAPAAEAQADPAARTFTLDELLNRSLDSALYSREQRVNFAEQAKLRLAASENPIIDQRATLNLSRSYLTYQAGDVAAALAILQPTLSAVTLEASPNLFVRTQSLYGGLQLLSGDLKAGLARLEALLSADLSHANPLRVANARVNYASALARNGSVEQAAELYEKVLRYGLDAGHDMLALGSGSNFVSHLNDQKLYEEADYWIARLEPAMEQLPDIIPVASLKLQKLLVLVHTGQLVEAISALETYLANAKINGPPAALGNGYQLYALALLENGQLAESLAAAEIALDVLESNAIEKPETQLVMVRALLAMGDSTRAGEVLGQVDQSLVTGATDTNGFYELKLLHQLMVDGGREALSAFASYRESNEALAEFMNARQSDHYRAKLVAAQQKNELALSRDQQAILAAEAETARAQANELEMRASSASQRRKFQLGLILSITTALVAFIFINANRRLERGLRIQEQKQNASLTHLVDQKSQALVDKIIEQSRLEKALSERRHMEAIGHLAGNLAHDFNNLLQVVSGANDTLKVIAQDTPLASALQASNQSLRIGASTIKQLLAYSRRQELEATTIVLSEFFLDTHELFRSAVGEPYELTIEDTSGGSCVRLDMAQLTTALLNLLRNAVDSMPGFGIVTIRARCVGADEVRQRWPAGLQNQALNQIQVEDTGCGMDTEQLERALEPFYSTKGDSTGTGLGLSSVFGFVKQSGGDMYVESHPAEGTVVTLLFPVQAKEQKTLESPKSYATKNLKGANILLVEDNELIARTLQLTLDRIGVDSHWEASTDLARQTLRSGRSFDFVLSDIRLPGALDGLGLAKWIGSEYPQMQVFLMSGYGSTEGEYSEYPVLSKPFTQQELIDFVSLHAA